MGEWEGGRVRQAGSESSGHSPLVVASTLSSSAGSAV